MVLANNNLPAQLISPQPLEIDEVAPAALAPIVDELAPLPEKSVKSSARPSGDLASLVAQFRGSDPGSRELECLAVGIYFESKSEPIAGQLAVGEVIANRAKSGRFASSYCGVLFQRSQFSFIRGRALPSVPRSSRQWSTAVAIAKIVDQKLKTSAAPKALFFHAKRVSPGWKLKRVAAIGNHIFYR
jgi:spore germination cell wall hydrolase CwlJ-like protein